MNKPTPFLEDNKIIVPFVLTNKEHTNIDEDVTVYAVISKHGVIIGEGYVAFAEDLTFKPEPLVYEKLSCGKGWLLRPYDSEHFITIYLSDEGLLADIWGLDVDGDEYIMDETGIEYYDLFFTEDGLDTTKEPKRELRAYGIDIEVFSSVYSRVGLEEYFGDAAKERSEFDNTWARPPSLNALSKEIALIAHNTHANEEEQNT